MSGAGARRKGHDIERLAESWLQKRGLKPVARNYCCRLGELDLVMQEPGQLVVVEVKYRQSGALVSGAESLTINKQKRIARTTLHFLQRHETLADQAVRFDLVAVTGKETTRSFEWIRDAFRTAL